MLCNEKLLNPNLLKQGIKLEITRDLGQRKKLVQVLGNTAPVYSLKVIAHGHEVFNLN